VGKGAPSRRAHHPHFKILGSNGGHATGRMRAR
jgi:hypothetical protein